MSTTPSRVDGPVAIVTAASSGIGRGIAAEPARRGYRLSLLSRGESVRDLAQDLDAVATTGSLASPDDLRHLVGATMDAYGRIDAVVNGCGHPANGDLLEVTDEMWRAWPAWSPRTCSPAARAPS